MNRLAAIVIAAFFPLLASAQTQSKTTEANSTGAKSNQTSETESPQTTKTTTAQTGKAQPTPSKPLSPVKPDKFFGLNYLESELAVFALIAAGLLMVFRARSHRHNLAEDDEAKTFLLQCPNLTLVALIAAALLEGAKGSSTILVPCCPSTSNMASAHRPVHNNSSHLSSST